jgi:cytochrome P450
LKSSSYHPWISIIFSVLKGAQLSKTRLYYPRLWRLFGRFFVSPDLPAKMKYHRQMTRERTERRLQQSTGRNDFLCKLVDPGNGIGLDELADNTSLFTNAGSETTASLLAALTYLLLINPEKLDQLKREVRDGFMNNEEITCESVKGMKYTNACIEEALRLFPPVPLSLPRKVPKGGEVIEGSFVAEEVRTLRLVFSWAPLIADRPP